MEWPWIVLGAAGVVTSVPLVLHLARRRRGPGELDFNIIDEALHHIDSDKEPFSVHVEARVEGRIDDSRLRAAVTKAAARHPMARVRQQPWRPWHTWYRWQVDEGLTREAVDVVDCGTDDDFARARAAFVSRRVPIDASPPFRLLLAHREGGDSLALNFNHAASDGVGTLRFLRSVARGYADVDDPTVDVTAARDLTRSTAPADLRERLDRIGLFGEAIRDAVVAPPARLVAAGGTARPGFDVLTRVIDPDLTTRLATAKLAGGTVNDTLLAVLHRTIEAWNRQHDASSGRVSTMMPINVRAADMWLEGVSNITYFVSISTTAAERELLATAAAAVRSQTARMKETNTASALRELLFASPALLIAVKRRLPQLLPLGGERFMDSAVLSNLGRVQEPLVFGDAGVARELWFSPPCRMPLGLGVGAATYDGRLFLTYRYPRSLWDEASARRFADLFVEDLARL